MMNVAYVIINYGMCELCMLSMETSESSLSAAGLMVDDIGFNCAQGNYTFKGCV